MSLAFVHAHDCSDPHTEAVWGISWTANDTIVSVSADGSVKQFVAASGQPSTASMPPPHTLGQVSLSVTRDGSRALCNTVEGVTSLVDLGTGEVLGKHESYVRDQSGTSDEDGGPSWSVSLHPDGTTYAASGSGGKVVIYSAQADSFGKQVAKFSTGRSKYGMFCQYSPDGKRVALASETGQIYVFDVEQAALSATFTSHALAVRSLVWSADSNLLLSASEDKRLALHDVRDTGGPSGGAFATFIGHSSWALSVDISQDSRLALSGQAFHPPSIVTHH
ncbi:WD repeat-containing protein 61 [Mycena indigotica]|uniref:WD repeat-containing protein 61 n=1 Tax=Mycena indigotica TaxID=2126181 RepID=A0A8H6SM84_9AGAR|nr:WD repeat-containing protein 61 [Mycena indigotica]KAF7301986.1 WD repeat-containing protein 61 [Mycena indigotica]